MAGAAAAGVLLAHRKLGLVTAGLALLMAATRVYVGAHFPLDVVAGLAVGAALALTSYAAQPLVLRLVVALSRTVARPSSPHNLRTSRPSRKPNAVTRRSDPPPAWKRADPDPCAAGFRFHLPFIFGRLGSRRDGDLRMTTAQRTATTTGDRLEPSALDWRRAARLWVVVAAFIGIGIARSVQVGIPFRDPHGAWLLTRVGLTVAIFTGLVVLDGFVRCDRPRPGRQALTAVRSRWTPRRLALAWSALLAYHLTYFTYHNLKSWNVFNPPRDAMLTAWDRRLFFGHSPAVLLHDLLGQHVAAWVLMVWYEAFPTLVVGAFPAAVVLAPRMRDAYVGIAAFVWVWILGTATYYAIPSLGPFHSAPGDFAGLPRMPIQDTQARYLAQRDDLLAHPHAADAFAQISAFASLHVAVTATILGLAWWHRLRRTTAALAVFLAGTAIATVYLGWHFAVDIPAGLLISALAWLLAPLTVGVRRRPVTNPALQGTPETG